MDGRKSRLTCPQKFTHTHMYTHVHTKVVGRGKREGKEGLSESRRVSATPKNGSYRSICKRRLFHAQSGSNQTRMVRWDDESLLLTSFRSLSILKDLTRSTLLFCFLNLV